MSNRAPVIIVLNGASSSGKTVTAQALRKVLGTNCVVTGFDDILEREKPFGSEDKQSRSSLQRMVRILWFQFTNGRFQLFQKLHREVVAYHRAGHDVIVETSLMEHRVLQDAAACFSSVNAVLVAMKPPLAVSEKWEAQRNDRPPGQARKHYDLIHEHGICDLMLDPSKISPEECASIIQRHISEFQPGAFQTILKQQK